MRWSRRAFLASTAAFALSGRRVFADTPAAIKLIQDHVDSGELAGATLHVQRGDQVTSRAFGNLREDAVFYLASITKPMTATCVMLLVDRGQVSLDDKVQKYIPEFSGDGREQVLVRHLITHTSGLPDMLPENEDLRKRHAPLSDFVAGTCRTPLLFAAGTDARYQSMGILLAGEIVARVTGGTLAEFMRTQLFAPLGMTHSSMGLGGRRLEDTVQLQHDDPTDWAQNSAYWRNLCAPWADVHSTATDVSRFARSFLHPETSVLKPQTAVSMITKQTGDFARAWGYGWSFRNYGTKASLRAVGHGGSSGVSMWIDPERDLSFVLLTSLPSRLSGRTILSPATELVSDYGS